MADFSGDHLDGFVALIVLQPTSPPPDSSARPIFAKAMHDCGAHIRGAAYYVPVAGFRGAAFRSVIAGLSLLARASYKTRAYEEIDEATCWLAGLLGAADDDLAQRIAAVVAEVDASVSVKAAFAG